MARIVAPNKVTGIRASVQFTDGIGETSDEYLLDWFRTHGYKVVKIKENDLDHMTLVNLQRYANQHNIDLGRTTKRDEVLKIIKDRLFSDKEDAESDDYDDKQDYDDEDI